MRAFGNSRKGRPRYVAAESPVMVTWKADPVGNELSCAAQGNRKQSMEVPPLGSSGCLW